MKQIIYIDVLFFLNTIITFLLLLASSKLMKLTPTACRFIAGSLIGGVSSLIIFAPDMGFFLSIFTKLLFSLIITSVTYNPRSIKSILRQTGYFFTVSFIFAGIMLFASSLPGISVVTYNNGAIYIDFSFFSLIAASVICYLITLILNKITRHRHSNDVLFNIKIQKDRKSISSDAILDTGNGLLDPFTGESIIIGDKYKLKSIMPENIHLYINENCDKCDSIRLIPCSTVASDTLLPVFRADNITIRLDNRTYTRKHPLIAVSKKELPHIILPPDITEKEERSKTDEKAII